jgi:tetratricopeptide (TPR) repeat protein
VAVPLWAGLAAVAYAIAARRLPGARLGAAMVIGGVGVALVAPAARSINSPEAMWLDALHKDGSNMAAVVALTREPLRAKGVPGALEVLSRCDACACQARRAELGLKQGAPMDQVIRDAQSAIKACPDDPFVRSVLVIVEAYGGDAPLAESDARAALAKADAGRLHYGLAMALELQARHSEAIDEAKRAVEMGTGRDASLLLGAICISTGDLDAASRALEPLAADAGDTEAQFDLALIADKRNDYNRARNGYLAALRADPKNADARFNLTLLTLRRGVIAEAQHHAQRFAEAFPGDRRNQSLASAIAAATAKRP